MFWFIKKVFITAIMFVGFGALKRVSVSDQECKVRPALMNISINEPLFYPYSVLENKCSVTVIILINRILHYVFLKLLRISEY